MDNDFMKRLDAIEVHIKKAQHARVLDKILKELHELGEERRGKYTVELARICYLIGSVFFREGMATRQADRWDMTQTQSLREASAWFEMTDDVIVAMNQTSGLDGVTRRAHLDLQAQVSRSSTACRIRLNEQRVWVRPAPKTPRETRLQTSLSSITQAFKHRLFH